jgi:hypothetical protein
VKRVCASCNLRPVRRPTKRVPVPLFCLHCWMAEDQRPLAHDMMAIWHDQGVAREPTVRPELERRAVRIRSGRLRQAMAERLLASLDGLDRWIWSMVVAGVSERQIATRLGLSRVEVYGWYLQRLREAAGLPARPRRYNGHRAA